MVVQGLLIGLLSVAFNYGYMLFVFFVLPQLILVALAAIYRLKSEIYNDGQKLTPCRTKVVFITGSTSGIGLALAKYFYRRGFSIIVGYYSSEEPGYKELKELNAEEKFMFFVELNVRSKESIAVSYELIKDYLEKNNFELHALINNAGVGQRRSILWDKMESIVAIVETNLLGPALMYRQFVSLLARSPGSRLINTASILADCPTNEADLYGATKAAIAYLTQAANLDLLRYGISSVCIYPGNLILNTSIVADTTKDMAKDFDELKDEEKALFRKHYEGVLKRNAKIKDMIERFKLKARDGRNSARRSHGPLKSIRRAILWSLSKLSGSVEGSNLDETSLMINYDNAVCLKEPPSILYAGNRLYTLVWAAMTDCYSRKLILWLCFLKNKFDVY